MNEPFDKLKDKDKYEFFRQMTEAINEWMLKQYPEFDNELVSKIKEIRIYQEQVKTLVQNFQNDLQKDAETIKERLIERVNDFIKKEHPDLHDCLKKEVLNINKVIQQHKKNVEKTKDVLEKAVKSSSLYEDVYKMRDEFSEIKNFMNSFQTKIKKAFEI